MTKKATFSLLAPFLMLVIGALIAGYGVVKDWQRMINGGIVIAVIGLLFVFRPWWDDCDPP